MYRLEESRAGLASYTDRIPAGLVVCQTGRRVSHRLLRREA